MIRFFRTTDIPFATDETHQFLPWMIGIMAGLAALLLCLGLSLNHWAIDRNDHYTGSFTVNIPASEKQKEQTDKIKEVLKKTPGIAKIDVISDATLKEMLKPWLGSGSFDDLPLPALLEVSLTDTTQKIDYAKLEKELGTIASGTEIDAQERWAAAFSEFSVTLRMLIGILAFLIISAMAMIVAYASRASLKAHVRTVFLLHAIGAEDDYIMRQFQQQALRVALPGAALGCLAAGILYWASGSYLVSLKLSMLPPLPMMGSHIALLLLMPLLCGVAAWLVARFSISMQLQRIL